MEAALAGEAAVGDPEEAQEVPAAAAAKAEKAEDAMA